MASTMRAVLLKAFGGPEQMYAAFRTSSTYPPTLSDLSLRWLCYRLRLSGLSMQSVFLNFVTFLSAQ